MKTPARRHRDAARRPARAGQALIFLLVVLVVLVFVVLWNFDLHKTFYVKLRSQNAGDAAALAAARWQGVTLNLIGDLNLLQALALSADDAGAAADINELQARLCFVGPMIGLIAAQQAAKNNGAYPNPDFTQLLREHAAAVRNDYPSRTAPDGSMLFPEPYEGCWEEYADMLDAIAADGVAAAPDNARYYTDLWGAHTLLDLGFYEAIAGRNWCWFFHHAPTLLADYRNFFPCWWPPLPQPPVEENINSEIFGLALRRVVTSLDSFLDAARADPLSGDRGLPGRVTAAGAATQATWYCYGSLWQDWDAMSLAGEFPFPGTGPVRPQYNYAGADATTRVISEYGRLSPGRGGATASNTVVWTAAAKPFGSLEGPQRPDSAGVVLPAFTDARLIPVDASSAPAAGSYNLEWRRHIEQHLPDYMTNGPLNLPCWYCRQLARWEDPGFRMEGVNWLAEYSDRCTVTGGGGPGGGGRRRGH